ncbi:hypothetical protein PPTG_22863 [Phytophthora nicotianae INRA-310]|uniref:Uncharacterized protein n=2 Tax=Phytophthora nicotianae TaxID=4792 RepID=W2Q9X1_PHYN3|nr:hypothetical protein PPTG_22863 [Phytophthora nicotianae INRA-310]ETN09324.1 hypothetical protein PPTG_22863 [Phytophthora nicotianae INRA-310]ETO76175.1 hypothetical protein F444_08441 [Phytophthora nicotianae P1976]
MKILGDSLPQPRDLALTTAKTDCTDHDLCFGRLQIHARAQSSCYDFSTLF